MRSLTWAECEALAARHNRAVEDEEIGAKAVADYKRRSGADLWERVRPAEKRAFLNVLEARGRGDDAMARALRDLRNEVERHA
jgi:hypothetical protein